MSREQLSTIEAKEIINLSLLTIVNRLMPLVVRRTRFEPGMVPALTKFTHFISVDGVVIRTV